MSEVVRYTDIVEFVREVIGIELTPEQEEFLRRPRSPIIFAARDVGKRESIRIHVETILEQYKRLKKNKCPKCETDLEEDPEDSSEGYCPKCNYGWRLPR